MSDRDEGIDVHNVQMQDAQPRHTKRGNGLGAALITVPVMLALYSLLAWALL
jgi:hypothetical protein